MDAASEHEAPKRGRSRQRNRLQLVHRQPSFSLSPKPRSRQIRADAATRASRARAYDRERRSPTAKQGSQSRVSESTSLPSLFSEGSIEVTHFPAKINHISFLPGTGSAAMDMVSARPLTTAGASAYPARRSPAPLSRGSKRQVRELRRSLSRQSGEEDGGFSPTGASKTRAPTDCGKCGNRGCVTLVPHCSRCGGGSSPSSASARRRSKATQAKKEGKNEKGSGKQQEETAAVAVPVSSAQNALSRMEARNRSDRRLRKLEKKVASLTSALEGARKETRVARDATDSLRKQLAEAETRARRAAQKLKFDSGGGSGHTAAAGGGSGSGASAGALRSEASNMAFQNAHLQQQLEQCKAEQQRQASELRIQLDSLTAQLAEKDEQYRTFRDKALRLQKEGPNSRKKDKKDSKMTAWQLTRTQAALTAALADSKKTKFVVRKLHKKLLRERRRFAGTEHGLRAAVSNLQRSLWRWRKDAVAVTDALLSCTWLSCDDARRRVEAVWRSREQISAALDARQVSEAEGLTALRRVMRAEKELRALHAGGELEEAAAAAQASGKAGGGGRKRAARSLKAVVFGLKMAKAFGSGSAAGGGDGDGGGGAEGEQAAAAADATAADGGVENVAGASSQLNDGAAPEGEAATASAAGQPGEAAEGGTGALEGENGGGGDSSGGGGGGGGTDGEGDPALTVDVGAAQRVQRANGAPSLATKASKEELGLRVLKRCSLLRRVGSDVAAHHGQPVLTLAPASAVVAAAAAAQKQGAAGTGEDEAKAGDAAAAAASGEHSEESDDDDDDDDAGMIAMGLGSKHTRAAASLSAAARAGGGDSSDYDTDSVGTGGFGASDSGSGSDVGDSSGSGSSSGEEESGVSSAEESEGESETGIAEAAVAPVTAVAAAAAVAPLDVTELAQLDTTRKREAKSKRGSKSSKGSKGTDGEANSETAADAEAGEENKGITESRKHHHGHHHGRNLFDEERDRMYAACDALFTLVCCGAVDGELYRSLLHHATWATRSQDTVMQWFNQQLQSTAEANEAMVSREVELRSAQQLERQRAKMEEWRLAAEQKEAGVEAAPTTIEDAREKALRQMAEQKELEERKAREARDTVLRRRALQRVHRRVHLSDLRTGLRDSEVFLVWFHSRDPYAGYLDLIDNSNLQTRAEQFLTRARHTLGTASVAPLLFTSPVPKPNDEIEFNLPDAAAKPVPTARRPIVEERIDLPMNADSQLPLVLPHPALHSIEQQWRVRQCAAAGKEWEEEAVALFHGRAPQREPSWMHHFTYAWGERHTRDCRFSIGYGHGNGLNYGYGYGYSQRSALQLGLDAAVSAAAAEEGPSSAHLPASYLSAAVRGVSQPTLALVDCSDDDSEHHTATVTAQYPARGCHDFGVGLGLHGTGLCGAPLGPSGSWYVLTGDKGYADADFDVIYLTDKQRADAEAKQKQFQRTLPNAMRAVLTSPSLFDGSPMPLGDGSPRLFGLSPTLSPAATSPALFAASPGGGGTPQLGLVASPGASEDGSDSEGETDGAFLAVMEPKRMTSAVDVLTTRQLRLQEPMWQAVDSDCLPIPLYTASDIRSGDADTAFSFLSFLFLFTPSLAPTLPPASLALSPAPPHAMLEAYNKELCRRQLARCWLFARRLRHSMRRDTPAWTVVARAPRMRHRQHRRRERMRGGAPAPPRHERGGYGDGGLVRRLPVGASGAVAVAVAPTLSTPTAADAMSPTALMYGRASGSPNQEAQAEGTVFAVPRGPASSRRGSKLGAVAVAAAQSGSSSSRRRGSKQGRGDGEGDGGGEGQGNAEGEEAAPEVDRELEELKEYVAMVVQVEFIDSEALPPPAPEYLSTVWGRFPGDRAVLLDGRGATDFSGMVEAPDSEEEEEEGGVKDEESSDSDGDSPRGWDGHPGWDGRDVGSLTELPPGELPRDGRDLSCILDQLHTTQQHWLEQRQLLMHADSARSRNEWYRMVRWLRAVTQHMGLITVSAARAERIGTVAQQRVCRDVIADLSARARGDPGFVCTGLSSADRKQHCALQYQDFTDICCSRGQVTVMEQFFGSVYSQLKTVFRAYAAPDRVTLMSHTSFCKLIKNSRVLTNSKFTLKKLQLLLVRNTGAQRRFIRRQRERSKRRRRKRMSSKDALLSHEDDDQLTVPMFLEMLVRVAHMRMPGQLERERSARAAAAGTLQEPDSPVHNLYSPSVDGAAAFGDGTAAGGTIPLLVVCLKRLVEEFILRWALHATRTPVQRLMRSGEIRGVFNRHSGKVLTQFSKFALAEGSVGSLTYTDFRKFVIKKTLVDRALSDSAVTRVFRSVQPDMGIGLSADDLYESNMLYPEFCEALLAMALIRSPDPYTTPDTKLCRLLAITVL